jgi:hypothetical protein
MRWVTRADMHVDRTACAWLIRGFIDPNAEFVFVTEVDHLPDDATPFDIAGHPFSHHDGDCTFEVLVRHHGLTDPALIELGRIVHEADVEDERYDAPEAAGLDAIIRGMGSDLDDVGLLEASTPLYNGLLATIRMRTSPSGAGR